MPTYHYRCKSCGHEFEEFQSMSEDALTLCPECGKNTLVRVISGAGLVFKGSGFYLTDYKKPKDGGGSKEERAASKEGSSKEERAASKEGSSKEERAASKEGSSKEERAVSKEGSSKDAPPNEKPPKDAASKDAGRGRSSDSSGTSSGSSSRDKT